MAGYIGGGRRGQEYRQPAHFRQVAHPAQGNLALGRLLPGLVSGGRHLLRVGKTARGNGIDPDAVGRPFLGQGFGKAHYPGFGGIVRRRPLAAAKGGPAGYVDDAALPPFQQMLAQSPAALKRLGQVNIHDKMPLVLGHSGHADAGQFHHRLADGIADAGYQGVNMPELGQHLGGDGVHGGGLGSVPGQRQGGLPQSPYLGRHLIDAGFVQAGNGHIGPGGGKSQSDALANPPPGPGNQHLLPGHPKNLQTHNAAPFPSNPAKILPASLAGASVTAKGMGVNCRKTAPCQSRNHSGILAISLTSGGFRMTTMIDPRSILERVAALEEAVKHLASKEDLERVRSELLLAIERGQARQTRWTVGTIIATGAFVVAAIKLL